jgi:predicted enzyme related to lactoylglutathione lyase
MANNRVVHFEIPANQPEALTRFYGELFGWKFQKASIPGPEYWLCDTGLEGPGINGVMQRQNAAAVDELRDAPSGDREGAVASGLPLTERRP